MSGFWVVWNPDGNNPRRRHTSIVAAVSEAERLAQQAPGEVFIVLESVCSKRVINTETTDLVPTDDQRLPF